MRSQDNQDSRRDNRTDRAAGETKHQGSQEDGITYAISMVLRCVRVRQLAGRTGFILVVAASSLFLVTGRGGAETPDEIPDAPQPQAPAAAPPSKPNPCPAKTTNSGDPATAPKPNPGQNGQAPVPCRLSWGKRYEIFANGPQNKPLTPKDKAWLAARNVADPFNNVTILGEAAITIGSDSHTAYGPGMAGYGRYVGVSYSQDMLGEFFVTFLIPSIVHQDPHYHRMPDAKIPRRILHATTHVVWTQSDSGKGMPNYANLIGFAAVDGISNLYVPGRETSIGATASRYVIGLATAPIDNYVTEFVPDVARHIHVEVVVLQRIINQVARSEGGGAGSGQ